MIPKVFGFTAIICLCWLDRISGSSYSNVYVHSGPSEVLAQYGVPAVVTPQLAQLNAAPFGSVVPQLSNYIPACIPPCIPSASIPLQNARVVSYNSPKLPIVVAQPNNDPSGYEYSYVVYDQNTGDHKAQQELSDGVVVRGQYSLLQPDGYVREVKYTADDIKGFNAIVKSFLPQRNSDTPPCNDGKTEALKEEPKIVEEPKSDEVQQEETSVSAEKPVSEEKSGSAEKPASEEKSGSVEKPASEEKSGSAEKASSAETPNSAEAPGSVEAPSSAETPGSAEKSGSVETPASAESKSIEKPESEEKTESKSEEPKSGENSSKETSLKVPVEHVEHFIHVGEPSPPEVQQPAAVLTGVAPSDRFLSYSDLLKCIEATSRNNFNGPVPSPLTYILLPSNNLPCQPN